jgi:hypothetical protein
MKSVAEVSAIMDRLKEKHAKELADNSTRHGSALDFLRSQVLIERNKKEKLQAKFDAFKIKTALEHDDIKRRQDRIDKELQYKGAEGQYLGSYKLILKFTLVKNFVRIWKNKKRISAMVANVASVVQTVVSTMHTLQQREPRRYQPVDGLPEAQGWLKEYNLVAANHTKYNNAQRIQLVLDVLPVIESWSIACRERDLELREMCKAFTQTQTEMRVAHSHYKHKFNDREISKKIRSLERQIKKLTEENSRTGKTVAVLKDQLSESQKEVKKLKKANLASGLRFMAPKAEYVNVREYNKSFNKVKLAQSLENAQKEKAAAAAKTSKPAFNLTPISPSRRNPFMHSMKPERYNVYLKYGAQSARGSGGRTQKNKKAATYAPYKS